MKTKRTTQVKIAVLALAALTLGPLAEATLIGQWTFNEGSGTTALDSSGYGNNGTISGGATYVASGGGYALRLDGTDDFVSMGTPALFNINGPSAAFTLEAWVRITDWPNILANNFAAEPGIAGKPFMWGIAAYSAPDAWGYAGGSVSGWFGPDLLHQLVLTYDAAAGANNLSLYIDGTQVSTATAGAIANNLSTPFEVGRRSTAFFMGDVDEVRLYNTALSGSDITTLFDAGPIGIPEPSAAALALAAFAVVRAWRLVRRRP
jgi:hypothetical protein